MRRSYKENTLEIFSFIKKCWKSNFYVFSLIKKNVMKTFLRPLLKMNFEWSDGICCISNSKFFNWLPEATKRFSLKCQKADWNWKYDFISLESVC
jgi:hypothetical protein